MRRRFTALLSVTVATAGLVTALPATTSASSPPRVPAALASSPHLSVATRLDDRREVDAGNARLLDRVRGRPLLRERLAHHRRDGRRVDPAHEDARRRVVRPRRHWVGPATRFSSGWGYTRYALPADRRAEAAAHGLRARRQTGGACSASRHQSGRRAHHHTQDRRAQRTDGPVAVGFDTPRPTRRTTCPTRAVQRQAPRLHRQRHACRARSRRTTTPPSSAPR